MHLSLPERLAYGAYAALLRLASPAYLLKLWWRGRAEPGYRWGMAQRFGWRLPSVEPGAIWLHAVSLGETLAAAALVEALRRAQPELRLVLTHGTATGLAAGKALLREGDLQTWLPFDTPGAVRRFLRHTQPAVGVLMETEIWPNLLIQARAAGLPMILANARLSERSLRKGQRAAALLGPAVRALTLALAQTEADARRLQEAGVARVETAGNLKFDLAPDSAQQARGRIWRQSWPRQVVLFANSRDGEEALLLQAWAALPAPRPLLWLVPRHPQRFEEVAQLVAGQGWALWRRSGLAKGHAPAELAEGDAPGDLAPAAQADVCLGDSLGEMALYYSLADVALLGGSFMPLGGHNLIEAAANGCPLVLGPSTFNFALAAELALAAGAAKQAQNLPEALQLALAWLAEPAARQQAATAATAFACAHRGAAKRMARAIISLTARCPAPIPAPNEA